MQNITTFPFPWCGAGKRLAGVTEERGERTQGDRGQGAAEGTLWTGIAGRGSDFVSASCGASTVDLHGDHVSAAR